MMMIYIFINIVALFSCRMMLVSFGLKTQYIEGAILLLFIIFVLELAFSIMVMYEMRESTQIYHSNDISLISL